MSGGIAFKKPLVLMDLSPTTANLRQPTAVWEEAPDDVLVLDLDTGFYFGLGRVGGEIWQRLDGARTLDEIAREMVATYGIDLETAREDLSELVADLVERGLAQVSS